MHALFIFFLQESKIPPVMRKRGHPKGTNDTVIGLPTKKKKAYSLCSKQKVISFLRFHISLKEKGKFAHFLLFVSFTIISVMLK